MPVISDEQRREVAEGLRLICGCEIPTSDMYALLDETDRDHRACAVALYGAVGLAMDGAPSVRQAILRLADLIDRPIVPVEVNEHGRAYCPNCGCDDWCIAGGSHYCPDCGVELLGD